MLGNGPEVRANPEQIALVRVDIIAFVHSLPAGGVVNRPALSSKPVVYRLAHAALHTKPTVLRSDDIVSTGVTCRDTDDDKGSMFSLSS